MISIIWKINKIFIKIKFRPFILEIPKLEINKRKNSGYSIRRVGSRSIFGKSYTYEVRTDKYLRISEVDNKNTKLDINKILNKLLENL